MARHTFSPIGRLIFIVILLLIDALLIKNDYAHTQHFPFSIPKVVEDRIAEVFPTLAPIVTPASQNIEFSEGQWVGSIVYGKLTNHNAFPVSNPELFFSLSSSKDGSSYLDSFTATISAKLEPEQSIYFSQRFVTPSVDNFWWSTAVASVASYSGQVIPKPSKGQQVSTKKIAPSIGQPTATSDTGPWGVAKQINDVTWTIKLGTDDRMATPSETLIALNDYRKAHNSPPLTWSDSLAVFAQERAVHLNSIQSTDEHKGFKDYTAGEDNVRKLGFWALGENSGYGSKLIGVHLIEWVYASDPAHNANQLDTQWSHVGIGINGLAVVFIFGGSKI